MNTATGIRAIFLLLFAIFAGSSSAAAQSPKLLELLAEDGTPRFVVDSSGAFVSHGHVRDVGNASGCAAQIPATGPGTRFMWHPC